MKECKHPKKKKIIYHRINFPFGKKAGGILTTPKKYKKVCTKCKKITERGKE